MDNQTRELIHSLTDDIRDMFALVVPINMNDAVARMGGRIEISDRFVKSAVQKSGDGFIVTIPPHQTKEQQRFMVAQELGHLFLHMGYKTNSEIWKKQKDATSFRTGTMEQVWQVNAFAGALLMPQEMFAQKLRSHTYEETAKFFGVSRDAAVNRGLFIYAEMGDSQNYACAIKNLPLKIWHLRCPRSNEDAVVFAYNEKEAFEKLKSEKEIETADGYYWDIDELTQEDGVLYFKRMPNGK